MGRRNFAIPVKMWALVCTTVRISLTSNALLIWILALMGFVYLAFQRNFKQLHSFGIFYALLALLMYLIRYHGLDMIIFSEFYVLLFWNLAPVFLVSWDLITTQPGELSAFMSRVRTPTSVILGLLVVFRFFPTMKAELKGVGRSMQNRGLTAPTQIICHPAASCEYVLVPMLLRCLQIADQLSVSAVARGAERPGMRSSSYGKKADIFDYSWIVFWTIATTLFLSIGGVRI